MRPLTFKSNFAKNPCKIPMAVLVPFLLFGCSGGKTGKSKDGQVQTTGSEEQRKLAMGATAVPGVSVSAVFGADAEKLMAFGLKELGKSGDSLSLAGPVYKLSATADLTPGPDNCYAKLPLTSDESICFDEKIPTPRFLIPIVVPGTAAAPGLGLTGSVYKYSSFDENCLRALRAEGLPSDADELCFFDRRTKRREYAAAPIGPIPQPQPQSIPQAQEAVSQETVPQAQSQVVARAAMQRRDPDPRYAQLLAEQAKKEEESYLRSLGEGQPPEIPFGKKIPSNSTAYQPSFQRPTEYKVAPPADASQPQTTKEESEKTTNLGGPMVKQDPSRAYLEAERRLAEAEEQERLKFLKQQTMVVPNQLTEPVDPTVVTTTPFPTDIKVVSIVTTAEPESPTGLSQPPVIVGVSDPDEEPKQQSDTVSAPPSVANGVGETPLLPPQPRDCTNLKCKQPIAPPGCENAQLIIPDGECCTQVVCAGGNSTPTGQECRPEECPQAMPAPGCMGAKLVFTSDPCCGTIECAGGNSTPTGQNCVEKCASCSIDSNGKMDCPKNPCTVECT